jgi:hypothetical protein
MQTLLSDLAVVQAHWPTVVLCLGAWVSFLSTLQTAFTAYPKIDSVLTKTIGVFSFAQHMDVGGLSLPGLPLKKPAAPAVSIASSNAIKGSVLLWFAIALGFAATVALATLGSTACAQEFTTGPSVALLEVRPGFPEPVAVSPGAGWQANLNFFPTTLKGQTYFLLGAAGVVFGTALSSPTGFNNGSLSAGLMACSMNLACLGVGADLAGSYGGVFSGFQAKNDLFGLVMLNFTLESVTALFGAERPPRAFALHF